MSTAISSPGTYTASGEYHLTGNINGPLVFTNQVRLFGRGHTVQGSASDPNTWDTGITLQAGGSFLIDTKAKNFRVGVELLGPGSGIIDCDLSYNRYFGGWLRHADQFIRGGKIGYIGGVDDEKYAVAAQCDHQNPLIEGVQIDEMYPQANYNGPAAGEGLPVNFPATSVNGIMRRCICINQTAAINTYGVFGGAGGGHKVYDNLFRNFWRAIAMANAGAVEARGNVAWTDKMLADDQGIGCTGGLLEKNVVIGYTKAIEGPHHAKNIAFSFPAQETSPPPPEPENTGVVLNVAHTGLFGNIGTKTLKCVADASLFSYPSGNVTKVRLTIRGHSSEPTSLPKLYVGQPGGTLVQVTQNGNPTIAAPAGQEVPLDWVTLPVNKSQGLIWSTHDTASTADDAISAASGVTGATTHLSAPDSDTASTASLSGLTSYPGYLSLVTKVETDGF